MTSSAWCFARRDVMLNIKSLIFVWYYFDRKHIFSWLIIRNSKLFDLFLEEKGLLSRFQAGIIITKFYMNVMGKLQEKHGNNKML